MSLIMPACSRGPDDRLQLKKGESVVFIGNTFAERMHLFGYFETLLHSSYPDHQLKVRNMGWSGDELTLRPRPKNFGDLHKYLRQEQADVIFACFGMNESFAGPQGLGEFQQNLDSLIKDIQGQQYNGKSAPRIVLVSPIAHENLSDSLPDSTEHNNSLKLYTEVMSKEARRLGLIFVDLFQPTREMSSPGMALTFNGIHLTENGYWTISQMAGRSLGLIGTIDSPVQSGNTTAERLRRIIYEKNYYFFIRWRGPNGEYILSSLFALKVEIFDSLISVAK